MKHIKLRVNKQGWIHHTMKIFSAYHKLTDLEEKLVVSIVKYYLELKDKITDDDLLYRNFLDSTHRTLIIEEFKMKQPQLTKYLNQLKTKKVLKEEDGIYFIDSKFIPEDKIVFEFNITE